MVYEETAEQVYTLFVDDILVIERSVEDAAWIQHATQTLDA